TRIVAPWYSTHLIADADGPVHNAMMFHWGGKPWAELGCYLHNADLNEGKHIITLRGNDVSSTMLSKDQGAVGGSIDLLQPPILAHDVNESNPYSDAWRCSQSLVAKLTYGFVMTVYPWDMSSESFITSPATDPEGLQPTDIFIRGNALFWGTSTLKH